MAPEAALSVSVTLNGSSIELPIDATLLDALRETALCHSVKDGCSPQGQCGCCTVLVDGQARVSCVTPVRRIAGREITTLEGVDPALLSRIVTAFEATGAAQCGFCTPGIVSRLIGLSRKGVPSEKAIRTALSAHLCRCTGFQPIVEAALIALDPDAVLPEARSSEPAARRAMLESGVAQVAGSDVVTGAFSFAADTVHEGMRVAYATADGGYSLGARVSEARDKAAKRQGRNSTVALRAPLTIPELSDAVVRLSTCFVEPAYVEPDASFSEPGSTPTPPFANAGAFGAKQNSSICDDVRSLADEQACGVLAVWPREEVVRRGAKRPPVAMALRADGSGIVRVGVSANSDDLGPLLESARLAFPDINFETVEVLGPRVGSSHRGALIAEVLAARCVAQHRDGDAFSVTIDRGASACVTIKDGEIDVSVRAGAALCATTLRSYVIGAVHQAYSQVTTEGLAVDEAGAVCDLTIRSFGITTAAQTPRISVTIEESDGEAVPVGMAVLAATMAAVWFDEGVATHWPTRREVQ
jgi:hypothetical protein